MTKDNKTLRIAKDRKHRVVYPYGKGQHYAYVRGPLTQNLWYGVLEDEPAYIIAEIPEGNLQGIEIKRRPKKDKVVKKSEYRRRES